MNSYSSKSATRVLLVDDHQLFRNFIGSILEEHPEFQLVGQAEDGPTAVSKCVELQPSLVLLDIGLPRLNGIEVARRIRQFDPACRIVFLTQERSPEIVHETFGLGASAYVIKAHTASDLIPAMIAAQDGRYYVGSGVEGCPSPILPSANTSACVPSSESLLSSSGPAPDHNVGFYRDDASIVAAYAGFVEDALKAGKAVITVVTPPHREGILRLLQATGIDADAAIQAERFVLADVFELLEQVMVNDRLDLDRLSRTAVAMIERLMNVNPHARICACGEVAQTLLMQGKREAAMQDEQVWDELSRGYDMEILCAYRLDGSQLAQDLPLYQQVSAAHSLVTVR